MKMGTKEIKEVILVAADGVNVGLQVKKDGGKINLVNDLPLVLALVQDLPAALADMDQIPGELADLDAAEAADLVSFTMSKLAIAEGKAKLVLGQSLKVLAEVGVLVQILKA